MEIRKATIDDLESIAAVEAECFPPAEAASAESFRERLLRFPDCFWLMLDSGRLVSFVNGMATDEHNLLDEMYSDASLHNPAGQWLMIFGVDTVPEYRRRGCAARLLQEAIDESRALGRAGLCLTAKDRMVHYYERFGFVNEGVSDSLHGGAVWYQMRLKFSLS